MGFPIPKLYSRFQSPGFQISQAEFYRIPDSTSQHFPDSGIPLHGRNQGPRLVGIITLYARHGSKLPPYTYHFCTSLTSNCACRQREVTSRPHYVSAESSTKHFFSLELSGQIFFDTLNALFSSFMVLPLRFKKATYWTFVFIHSYLHFFLSWSLPVVGMGAPKRIMIRHYEYRKSRIFFKSVTDPKIYEPVSKRRRMKIWDENKKKKFCKEPITHWYVLWSYFSPVTRWEHKLSGCRRR